MSRIGKLLVGVGVCIAFGSMSRADTATVEPLSPVERQQADFYGAIAGTGPAVAVTWTIDLPRVTFGTDIELRLVVKNAANAVELLRPNLADRPEWKERFSVIQDVPGMVHGEFRYKLRPRNVGTFELPLPKYRFYNPRLPEGRRFQVAYADALILVVLPKPSIDKPSVRTPLDAPAHFFEELPVVSRSAVSPPAMSWWALITVAIVALPAWILFWRWRNPDAAKLAKIRRAKSVRVALDGLRKAERSPEPVAVVSQIVLRYLWERWHVNSLANTPIEVTKAMRAEGLPADKLCEVEELLSRCDEVRFAPGADNGMTLVRVARQLVERWEGAAL